MERDKTTNISDLNLGRTKEMKILCAANDRDIQDLFGKDIKDLSFQSPMLQPNSAEPVDLSPTVNASVGGCTLKRYEDFLDNF